MAINFPATPTLNQTYTYNGRTWTYNTVGWQATGSTGLTVYTKTNFTATAAQTTFSVTYTVGFVDVYYNGSKLSSSEYTATTGSTVVLGTACSVNDIVETIAWTISSSFNPSLGSASATSLAIGGATIGSNALAVTGTTQLNSALNYGGVTLSNAVTGTGNMVLSASPTLTGTLTAAAANFSNAVVIAVPNAVTALSLDSTSGAGSLLFKYNATQTAQLQALSGGGLATYVGSSPTLITTLNSTGLGIGRAPSGARLHVISVAATGNVVSFGNDITQTLNFGTSTTGVYLDNPNSGYMAFNIGTEKARIGSDGSFLVGTTTNAGAGCFVAFAAGSSDVIQSKQTVGFGYCYVASAITNSGSYYFCNFNGGTGGTIINNGTTTTYAATSDERMKDWAGIVQSDKRQMISDLWLGDFDIYDDFTKTGTPHRGFGVRAQQAYDVLGRQFGMAPPAKETDKWQAPSEPFGFLALWGVKDLYAENEALKASMAELTTRLAALEAK